MATCAKCEGEGGMITKRCEECISKAKEVKIRAAPARSGSDPVQPASKPKLNESVLATTGLFRAPALRTTDTKYVSKENTEGGGGASSVGGGGRGGGGDVSMAGIEEMMLRL